MHGNPLDVQVTSSVNIFPSTPQDKPTSVPLSIFDNASAGYSRCAAVWLYEPPSSPETTLTSSHLQKSLSQTLNYYPQWCGRLSYATPKVGGNHNERYQRIWVTYNTSTDIGISFVTANCPRNLSDFLPSTSKRKASVKAWDGSQLPSSDLLPETNLAISSEKDAPNVIIQFTTFTCGSTSIAISITHCFVDAVAMCQFAKGWSLTSRALLSGEPLPALTPIFDPQLLDALAAGNIDLSTPDPEIQKKVRSLPTHRYDWYKQVPGQPWPSSIPSDLPLNAEFSESEPIPWHQWDTAAPVSHYVLHFSAQEIEHIFILANTPPQLSRISKHDALLAHIWARINKSRELEPATKTYLEMTFGFRPRVNPPLPHEFLGSPITHAAIESTISNPGEEGEGDSQALPLLARSIRNTLSKFTADKIAAILHDKAYEVAPQRLWTACLGRRYILLTTWVRSGVYDVDFVGRGGDGKEGGGRLRYVEALMPAMDGLVEVLEAPGEEREKEGASWYADGVDVSVYLEKKAMDRLLVDEELWGIASES